MFPSGKSVVTAWSYHPLTLELMDQSDDEIIRKAKEDIELTVPGFSSWIEEAMVFRHSYGVARYPAGAYRRVLDFIESTKNLRGVSFVGSVLGGTSMEGSIVSALAAVRRVCQWGGTTS
jgi:protoporphyrinogen oxidase